MLIEPRNRRFYYNDVQHLPYPDGRIKRTQAGVLTAGNAQDKFDVPRQGDTVGYQKNKRPRPLSYIVKVFSLEYLKE